jgi:hypothetical protein
MLEMAESFHMITYNDEEVPVDQEDVDSEVMNEPADFQDNEDNIHNNEG